MSMARLIAATLAAIATLSDPARAATDVWLDVDPAAGMFERDVDDGLAMIQAFHSPELNIKGVSVVFGNSPLEDGLRIAKEITGKFGPEGLEVYRGAESAELLGVDTEAVEAMAAALEEGPLTLLAVGPLTNAATLLMNYPHLHDRIDALVVVAGRRPGQRFRPDAAPDNVAFPDANFEHDPAAMREILKTEAPLVMAPWEVSSHVWITHTDLERLAESGASGKWIAEQSESWIKRWERIMKVDGFNPFDTLAIGHVTHPGLIRCMNVGVWIEELPDDLAPAGSNRTKPYLLVDPDRRDLPQAVYCYEPEAEFKELLMERLSGPAE